MIGPSISSCSQTPKKSAGAAMVMALLVVAMLSIIATQVSGKIQFNLQKAANQSQREQAYWYALTAEQMIRQQLEQSLKDDELFNLDQAWAKPLQRFPFQRGEVRFSVTDEQACININALAKLRTDETDQQLTALEVRQLDSLLQSLGYGRSARSAFEQSLLDWLDEDVSTSGQQGAEDLYYSAQSTAYLAGNDLIWQLSELNLLAHPLPDQIKQLAPWLCALPTTEHKVNINTLQRNGPGVLQALLVDQLTDKQLERILADRPKTGYSSAQEFWQQLGLSASEDNIAISRQLDVSSAFFRARIEVDLGDSSQVWTSRFHLTDGKFELYSRAYGDTL